MNPVKNFFMACSGADLTILRRPECRTERDKYAAIGASALLSAAIAAASGGYALSLVLESNALSAAFGLLWGFFVFNVDKYLLPIITKEATPAGTPTRARLSSLARKAAAALPRLVLAFLMAFVIARPLELKLFDREIEAQVAESIAGQTAYALKQVDGEFVEIDRLKAEVNDLQQQVARKQEEVGSRRRRLDLEIYGAASGRAGYGPVALRIQNALQLARAELKTLQDAYEPRIDSEQRRISDLEAARDERRKQAEATVRLTTENSLWARLSAFDRLKATRPAARLADLFLLTLFALLLSAPVLVTMLSARGPYDDIHDAMRSALAPGPESEGERLLPGEVAAPAPAKAASSGAARAARDPYRLVGSVFADKYRLDEWAGGGGMGVVYRSTQVDANRRVAVKIFKPDILARHPDYGVLFEREVTAARRMRHPNIVEVIDSGTADDDIPFMVMEWLTGETLEHVIERGQLPLDRLTHIFRQICDAVSYAHEKGIIHLDLKPGNVFLVGSGPGGDRIKVIDFGMARVLSSDTGTTVTRFLGTYQYCSPEHFGGKVNSRSDVYSLGATLYHMLAGTLPFGASYVNAKAHPNLELPPVPSLLRMRPGLPEEVDGVVQKALSKSPDGRQASARQLFDEFSRACQCAVSA